MADVSIRDALTSDMLLLALVLFVGVAGSGVARWGLGQLGAPVIGDVIYIMGYAGMVFVIWYGWIRPLDITGPE